MVLEDDHGKLLRVDEVVVKQQKSTVYNFKVKDFHTYYVSNLYVWTHNQCEVVLPKVKTYEQARNKAFELLGDMGNNTKALIGRLQESLGFGKVIGRVSANNKKRWRLDYDPEKEIHINVEDFSLGKGEGKARKYAIPFEGGEELY